MRGEFHRFGSANHPMSWPLSVSAAAPSADYVRPKTVEVHLSNAYRKLGIGSRHDLAAALAETT
jgi:Bacterial regulatory proteins, luxR family